MQSLKTFSLLLIITFTFSSLAGCSSWVYRINIPQGNFLEQSDVDKLRINMTQEQVIFVLGKPVAEDAFDKTVWRYVYSFNIGRDNEQRKSLTLNFENKRLVSLSGDYKEPEEFNTPLEQE
ncbi:outer membrane protein assembly factor BamE [Pseudoalteromonas sp. MMG010]|uniref:outer membrane protein assembly factor BamE n=1 Tax=Pseudoalteromonas sp. MMG010 TaxID=2822685 RepID=UPI001B3A52D4|nr:outer membrane protein assembly factor BamE [Pseudoalteromonas sp. MMG010]MBQ4831735.1 outer membrane protein assembly factor BamE [Pseudoalteromonas sp. MMG010]